LKKPFAHIGKIPIKSVLNSNSLLDPVLPIQIPLHNGFSEVFCFNTRTSVQEIVSQILLSPLPEIQEVKSKDANGIGLVSIGNRIYV